MSMLFRKNLPHIKSKIRFLNANYSQRAFDIYINENCIGKGLGYSKMTKYNAVSSGNCKMEIYLTGNSDKIIAERNLDICPNSSYTISIVTLNNKISLFILKDKQEVDKGTNCSLRFINLLNKGPLISLALNNDEIIFKNVEYLETTGYYSLPSAIYNFKVKFPSRDLIEKIIPYEKLEISKCYTLYLIDTNKEGKGLEYILSADG